VISESENRDQLIPYIFESCAVISLMGLEPFCEKRVSGGLEMKPFLPFHPIQGLGCYGRRPEYEGYENST
jgi:hypothetical protein